VSLTADEIVILRTLKVWRERDYGYARPMDVGGSDGSNHSAVLKKLARYGLVDRKRRNTICNVFCNSNRGSYVYAITDAGIAEIATNHPANTGDK
jgi:hypothetical protein